MLELTIDGKLVSLAPGTTLLAAAESLGITIPTLCHWPGLAPGASCFLCVVALAGQEKLLPACATMAEAGMTVITDSPEIREARRLALDLLLSDHVGDCEAPCRSACPASMDISGMNRLLVQEKPQAALALVWERIPLAGTIGRICPRFCERACRREQLDESLAIGSLHANLGETTTLLPPPDKPVANGKRVVVVGAGPAGLAGAFHLVRAGMEVTILEAEAEAGGKIRKNVGANRLSPELLTREIDHILGLGCELKTGMALGRDVNLDELLAEYDAVLLATGAVSERSGFAALGDGADRATGATSMPGVFAAGEALVTTGNAAVRAVASGRRAALAVRAFLVGSPVQAEPRPVTVRLGKLSPEQFELLFSGYDSMPRQSVALEMAGGDQAGRAEAARCLHCGCAAEDDCLLRIQATAHGARPRRFRGDCRELARDDSHPDVVFEAGKCISCGICVRLTGADQSGEGMIFTGRGFPGRIATPFGIPLAEALGEKAEACVAACPTGALAYRIPGSG